ncbi:hypothetical protein BMJ35_24465, partial [Sinorhizobium medicae]
KDTKVQVVIRNHIHCRFVANEPARGASLALGAQAFDLPPLLLLPAKTVACIARRRGPTRRPRRAACGSILRRTLVLEQGHRQCDGPI